jgi:hypothetical protein
MHRDKGGADGSDRLKHGEDGKGTENARRQADARLGLGHDRQPDNEEEWDGRLEVALEGARMPGEAGTAPGPG